ncbi:DUF2505 domain-containing protein [Mycolicibacterium sp. 050232]|uniref:DUF2505 domain-containing protein n=1 Tax=Mycolicibacterium sp. 050232 TaxID=3113982 RepID=UPI002E2AAAB4|nr:DUF2505 domain-containing protein [Mycolicibacterium sp. 050232]MED5814024.1 DUF2505 domain-containing protein [Mycolicibacterium sp. 050232]
MPRSFNFSLQSAATVEQIHSAFSREDYWLTRLTSFGAAGRLESLTVEPDGRVIAVAVHDLRPDGLPQAIAKFFPRQWRVVQTEIWKPTGDGRVRGKVSVVTHGAPGSGTGRVTLAPTRHGSQLKGTGTVEFRVPLVGGQIEKVMGRGLVQNMSVLQDFTAQWINEHT